jgi:hypothetical protein
VGVLQDLPRRLLGEHKWVVGFQEEIWKHHTRAPRPGQRVDVFWIKDLPKEAPKRIRRDERVRQIEQLVFSKPIEEQLTNHPEGTGGNNVPLELIQIKVRQPLPLKGERLVSPEFRIVDLDPEPCDPIKCKQFPILEMIPKTLATNFMPDQVGILQREVAGESSWKGRSSINMVKIWRGYQKEFGDCLEFWIEGYVIRAVHEKQAEEWDFVMKHERSGDVEGTGSKDAL